MPSEQPPTRVHECPTCGSPVEVVSSDEGTHHYRPAPSEQPREGSYNEQADRVFSEQPRGEGDELAARLEEKARAAIEKALLWYADPDHWLDGQAGEWIVEEGNHVSGDGFAHNEFEHDNGERARAALEPASPTPTEQENDR